MMSDLSHVTLTCRILCAVGSSPVLDTVFSYRRGTWENEDTLFDILIFQGNMKAR